MNATHPILGVNALINLCSFYKKENLFEIIEILLNAGININARASDQSTALLALATFQLGHRDFIEILRLFIQRGIDVHACYEDGWDVLHILCNLSTFTHLAQAIPMLIEQGIDFEARNNDGQMPVDVLMNRNFKKKRKLLNFCNSFPFVSTITRHFLTLDDSLRLVSLFSLFILRYFLL